MPAALPKLIERTFTSYGNSTVVKAATADGNGNNIASTYATQSSLNATNATVTAHGTSISNIQSAITGRLYNFPEDSAAGYIKDVPSRARSSAVLLGWSGKSLAWNQIVQNGNFASTSYWFKSDGATFSVSGNVASFTSASHRGVLRNIISAISGHKYFLSCDVKLTTANAYFGVGVGSPSYFENEGIYFSTRELNTSWNTCSLIGTYTKNPSSTDVGVLFMDFRESGWDSIQIRNVNLIDLTQMFGAGNEPTTVAQFRSMFPADYYAYNAGEAVSAQLQSVKSVGVNLCDGAYSNRSRYYIDFTPIQLEAGTYTFRFKSPDNGADRPYFTNYGIIVDGRERPLLAGDSYTFDLTTTKTIKLFGYRANYSNSTSVSEAQLEKGSTATSYKPYFSASWSVPSAVKAIAGYGWSAGSVSNEVNCETGKYVQRVGRVDLGTLNWGKSGNKMVSSIPSDCKQGNAVQSLCANYVRDSGAYYETVDKSMIIVNGYIYVYDTSYTDAATFKSAMSGKYLYYELETPVETDISTMLSARVPITVEGGGTIEMKNQLTSMQIPIASREGYAVKLA